MCGLVGVYYIDLGSIGYNLGGKEVVSLYVVLVFLVLSVFYSKFGSLLVILTLCH